MYLWEGANYWEHKYYRSYEKSLMKNSGFTINPIGGYRLSRTLKKRLDSNFDKSSYSVSDFANEYPPTLDWGAN